MNWLPKFDLTFVPVFLVMIPMFLVRYLLAKLFEEGALEKLYFFPMPNKKSYIGYVIYQITIIIIIFMPIFIQFENLSVSVWIIYIIGMIIFSWSVVIFSKEKRLVTKNIYKYSRNPMIVGYLMIFLAVGIMIQSILYIIVVIVYQIGVHYLIIGEEEWLEEKYGEEYLDYKKKTRRYF